jgi:hypothetical protein
MLDQFFQGRGPLSDASASGPDGQPPLQTYIHELVSALPEPRRALLAEDLRIFDQTGFITPMVDELIRRAECLSDADRILAKL